MGNEKELFALARELYTQGKLKESEVVFRQLEASSDFASDALSGLGMIRLKQGNNTAASELFEAALTRRPTNANSHYGLGVLAERQGALESAIAQYRKALTANPNHRDAAARLNKLQQNAPRFVDNNVRNTSSARETVSPEQIAALRNAAAQARAQGQPISPNPNPEISALLLESGELLDSRHRSIRSFTLHFLFTLVTAIPLGLTCIFGLGVFILGGASEKSQGFLAFVGSLLFITILLTLLRWRSRCTVYDIYERRIDIREGLLFRKEFSIWSFEITNPTLHRSLLDVIFGNGRIRLIENAGGATNDACIIGFGTFADTRALWQALRDSAIKDRLSIKRMWI
ncbi:tetratricopeptide repeat protein [Burkholderia ubonensis]|uniref:tetratricopeptide repeat protein n=1 Tax=Burkholderia ubonensis TaxID=101571 RepID=UPI002ABE362E|nr:tetratricopeptide repeat protein [Burkholderia ubonensis]